MCMLHLFNLKKCMTEFLVIDGGECDVRVSIHLTHELLLKDIHVDSEFKKRCLL